MVGTVDTPAVEAVDLSHTVSSRLGGACGSSLHLIIAMDGLLRSFSVSIDKNKSTMTRFLLGA